MWVCVDVCTFLLSIFVSAPLPLHLFLSSSPLIHAHSPFSLFFFFLSPTRVTRRCPLDHSLQEKVKLLTWSPDFVIYWLGRRSLCVSNGRKDVSINIRDNGRSVSCERCIDPSLFFRDLDGVDCVYDLFGLSLQHRR